MAVCVEFWKDERKEQLDEAHADILSTLRCQPKLKQGWIVGDSEELLCVTWTIDILQNNSGQGHVFISTLKLES